MGCGFPKRYSDRITTGKTRPLYGTCEKFLGLWFFTANNLIMNINADRSKGFESVAQNREREWQKTGKM